MKFFRFPFRPLVAVLAASLAVATASAEFKPVDIDEVFFTDREPRENVDSPAAWSGPDGQQWMISTCKGTHNLRIERLINGAPIINFGGLGDAPGQFNRPNGIAVVDDLLLVVERDNRRVQVLALPSLQTITTFGEDQLRKPYGLWVHKHQQGMYSVYVTDDYSDEADEMPADADLGERVKLYELEVEGSAPQTGEGEFVRSFGATSGEGRLFIVESLYGDPHYNRLLIADEEMSERGQSIKVYTLEGEFTGTIMGKGIFQFQAEGIALYDAGDGEGLWICTDQGKSANYFHLFDRRSLAYVGTFSGPGTLNTDGIWLAQFAVGKRYPQGLFLAVHNDGNVAAFDFADILKAFAAR